MYMRELDHKESWAPKNWCLWTVVLEKILESPLDCKEIKPVNPKGNQSWICIGRTDAEAAAPIHWPPDGKNWLLRKDPDAGKDWRQEEKGMTEDEMVGWHHQLDGHEFEQALGVGDGQESLACCSPWGHKESDMTERLNWTELIRIILHFFIFHFKCQKVQKWISTRCSTSFPSCEAPVPSPQTQMGVYAPLTVECLQLLPGGSEAQWGGGRQWRVWEANVPRSQGRSSRATCHSACRRPVPTVGFQTSVISW